MADYGSGLPSGFGTPEQAENPFQPANLFPTIDSIDPNDPNPFAPKNAVEASQSWFGGRNLSGTANGWDTEFNTNSQVTFQEALDKAAKDGNPNHIYNRFDLDQNPLATGVVTWNDEAKGLRAGDVFDKGVKKENIYDVYKDDKATADLLMTQAFLMTGQEQERINKEGLGDGGVGSAEKRAQVIDELINKSTEHAAGSRTAWDFKQGVEERETTIDGATSAWGSFAAGAGAGAATGAVAGLIGGPLAPVTSGVGALFGAAIGGAAAFLNRDQITEATARNLEIVEQADDESQGGDSLKAFFAATKGVGEVGMLAGQPVSNTVQGIFDEMYGTAGDGTSEWYKVDPQTGGIRASAAWEALNLGATLADGVMQFASPTGRGFYFATMSAATGGKAGNTFLNDEVFNERTGQWDQIEGAAERFGAYGSVGIDAVQMGTVGAFASRTKSLQQAAGLAPKSADDAVLGMWKKLPKADDLAKATQSEVVNGRRVFKDFDGNVVASRLSIQLLAPSEATKYVTTSWRGRRIAAADGGRAMIADDFYRAAGQMNSTASRWNNAMLSAFAEGNEEAAQALLDPLSTGDRPVPEQVYKSMLYGMASGAGMALGAQVHGNKLNPTGASDAQLMLKALARKNIETRRGEALSDEQWGSVAETMSDEYMMLWAAPQDEVDAKAQAEALANARKMMVHENMNNPLGASVVQAILDDAETALAPKMSNGTPYLTMLPRTTERIMDAAGDLEGYGGLVDGADMSGWQLVELIKRKVATFTEHAAARTVQLNDLTLQLDKANEAGDQRLVNDLSRKIAAIQQDEEDSADLIAVADQISTELAEMYLDLQSQDPATQKRLRKQIVDEMNSLLQGAANEGVWYDKNGRQLNAKAEHVQRTVELLFGRQPFMDQAAAVRIVPQVSLSLTDLGANGQIHVGQELYKIMNADNDGDNLQGLLQVWMNNEYMDADKRGFYRQGRQSLATVKAEKVKSEDFDPDAPPTPDKLHAVLDPIDTESEHLDDMVRWSESADPAVSKFVRDEVDRFVQWAQDRYGPVLGQAEVKALLDQYRLDLAVADVDSRNNLIDGLLNLNADAFFDIGQAERTQEPFFLSSRITLMMDRAQVKVARYATTVEFATDDKPASQRDATDFLKSSVLVRGATLGAWVRQVLGDSVVRSGQKLNYGALLKASIAANKRDANGNLLGLQPDEMQIVAREYMLASSGTVQTKTEAVNDYDLIRTRAADMIRAMVDEYVALTPGANFSAVDRQNLALMFSQVEVRDPDPEAFEGITLLQMLLRASLDMEEKRFAMEPPTSEMRERINTLRRMTKPGGERSYTASQALLEVFGTSMLGDLLGDLHSSLSPNLQVQQLVQQIQAMGPQRRTAWAHLQRNSIGYIKHRGLGDPPYRTDDVGSFLDNYTLNGYTILVDAISAVGSANFAAKTERNKTVEKTAQAVFTQLHDSIKQWREIHLKRLQAKHGEVTLEIALQDMLAQNPDNLASTLKPLFTKESREATFAFDADAKTFLARSWVTKVLLEPNAAKAAHLYHVYIKLDEMIQLGHKEARKQKPLPANFDTLSEETQKALLATQGLRYDQINSRLGQTLYNAQAAAETDGGVQLFALERAMFQTETNEEMYDLINDNPALLHGRERLLAWFDDVSEFEARPSDMFSTELPGATQREALTKVSQRLSVRTAQQRQEFADRAVTKKVVERLLRHYNGKGDARDAGLALLFEQALNLAKNVQGMTGPNAYDGALEAMQHAFVVVHEKSKAPEQVKPLAGSILDAAGFGRHGDVQAETANITAINEVDLLSNPSRLLRGPVTVQFGQYGEGETVTIDWSDKMQLLEALMNESTFSLAMSAISPIVYDLNAQGDMQVYSLSLDYNDSFEDRRSPYDLGGILQESTLKNIHAGDGRLSYDQAWKYIAMVESKMRTQATHLSREAQQKATHPIFHMITDIMVAYMQAPDAERRSPADMRKQVTIDVAMALQKIGAVKGNTDAETAAMRQRILDRIRLTLEERVGKKHTSAQLQEALTFGMDEDERVNLLAAAEFMADTVDKENAELLNGDTLTEEQKVELLRQWQAIMNARQAGDPTEMMRLLSHREGYHSFDTVLNYFTIDDSTPELKKASIDRLLDYMGDLGRAGRFNRGKNGSQAAALWEAITDKMNSGVSVTDIKLIDWQKLASFAAVLYYGEMYSPTASMVGVPTVDIKNEQEMAYMDASFGYLAAPLFDPQTLLAVEFLGQSAKIDPAILGDTTKIADNILDTLFTPKRLGDWSQTVATESRAMRSVIIGAPVNDSLTTAGVTPDTMQAQIAAGRASFEGEILPQHMSTYQIKGSRAKPELDAILRSDQLAYVKLEHHFASRIIITSDSGDTMDLMPFATVVDAVDPIVESSPYRVLSTQRLQDAINLFLEATPAARTFTIDIEYIDVDKRPPTDEYVNNVFFDGVGRNYESSSTLAPLAAMYMGTLGINKLLQQNPLDFATKAGAAFFAYETQSPEVVAQISAGVSSFGELMGAKALHLWRIMYTHGELMRADLPALYKMVKYRHLAQDPEGNLYWPDQAIAMEQQAKEDGAPLPKDYFKPILLSDKTADKLLQNPSSATTAQGLETAPLLVNSDGRTWYPPLDRETLTRLGLSSIGRELTSLENTPVAQRSVPLPAYYSDGRSDSLARPTRTRMVYVDGARLLRISNRRQNLRESLSMTVHNAAEKPKLHGAIRIESLLPMLAGTPQEMQRTSDLIESLRAQLISNSDLLPGFDEHNSAIWNLGISQQGSDTSGMMRAELLQYDIKRFKDNPDWEGDTDLGAPIPGDVLRIDLVKLLDSLGRLDGTADRHEAVVNYVVNSLEPLIHMGMTIAFTAGQGGSVEVREALGEWLTQQYPYRKVAGSSYFYAPITQENNPGAAFRSREQTQTSIMAVTGDGVTLTWLPRSMVESEAGALMHVDRFDPATREGLQIIPQHLTYTSAGMDLRGRGGTSFMFGIPSTTSEGRGTFQDLRKHVLPMLLTPEGRQAFIELFQDPPGATMRRVNPNGTVDPGIVSREDAVDRLISSLEATEPLVGREVGVGDIFLVTDNKGHILALRHGFRPPTNLNEQYNNGEVQDVFDAMMGRTGRYTFATVSDQIDDKLSTTAPAIIEEVEGNNRFLVTFKNQKLGKMVDNGVKVGPTPIGPERTPVLADMSRNEANDLGILLEFTADGMFGKGADEFAVDNFRNAFATFGISFKEPLIRYFSTLYDTKGMSESDQWDLIMKFLDSWQYQDSSITDAQLQTLWNAGRYVDDMSMEMEQAFSTIFSTRDASMLKRDLLGKEDVEDVDQRIALLVLASLRLPGVKIPHVIGSRGFINFDSLESGELTTFMPSILTDALNDPVNHPETYKYLFAEMNKNFKLGPNGEILQGLDTNWNYWRYIADPGETDQSKWRRDEGQLVINVWSQVNENPTVQTWSQVKNITQRVSPYMRTMTDMLGMGKFAYSPDRLREDGTVEANPVQEFIDGVNAAMSESDASLEALLPKIRKVDDTFNATLNMTYLQQRSHERATKRANLYYQLVPRDPKKWTQDAKIKDLSDKILDKLNMQNRPKAANTQFLDILVRLQTGRPGPAEDQDLSTFFDIEEDLYISALLQILKNVTNYRLPTINGEVPLPPAQIIMETIYRAQEGAARPWAPMADGGKIAVGWEEWVGSTMGQLYSSKTNFQYIFSADLQGMWLTYSGISQLTQEMALTPNQMVNAKLASPNSAEAAELYAQGVELTRRQITPKLALEQGEAAMMGSVILREDELADLDALLGKSFTYLPSPYVEDTALAKNNRRQAAWRAKNGIAKQEYTPMTNYLSDGKKFMGEMTLVNGWGRTLTNVSLINRMLNPAIWVSGLLEMPVRTTIQNLSDLLTGQSIGLGGKTMAKLGARVGLEPAYSAEEIQLLDDLAKALGKHPTWRAELVEQLNYQVLVAKANPDAAKGKRLERLAGAVSSVMSDPRKGISGTYLARLYLGGVLEYLNMTTGNVISIQQFVTELERDPMRYARTTPDDFGPHIQGLNRLAQTRAMKPTVASSMIMRPLAAGMRSENSFVNFMSHLAHLPFMFTTFNMNALVTFTGLAGWDQALAMMIDSRKKPRLFGWNKSGDDRFDMNDIIESIDLQRTFIRSGITSTMVFTLGMMAAGQGLGGEDEEEKRRRRLSQYLNVDNYGDPLAPENDIRFADAIFLDRIPILNNIFKTKVPDPNGDNDKELSVVVPHWIIQQFTSPIMGIERFFRTGNPEEIFLGFKDAYAAMPNSVTQLWNQGETLAMQLMFEAEEAAKETGNPRAADQANEFLIKMVSVLERSLIENAIVNQVVMASDEYDRNPYLRPKTQDESTDGFVRTQGERLPVKSDQRIEVLATDGQNAEIITPYAGRTGMDAKLHAYAEGNAVFSLVASLFTGQGDSTFLRKNMVVREKVVPRPDTPEDAAKALIYASYYGAGGEFRLNESEIFQMLKAQAIADSEDGSWDQVELEAKAKVIYLAHNGDTALTTTNEVGEQVLTKYGNVAFMRGLFGGQVELGDPSIQGIALTYEQRQEIAKDMLTEIKQDAIDLGLSEESSNYVMRRVWFGDPQTGSPGLKDFVWSKDIPYSNTLRYNQLNVMFNIGPDGKPWATPFQKTNWAQALGIPVPNIIPEPAAGTSYDLKGNVVDDVAGINTGLAGLKPLPLEPPPDGDDKALKDVEAKAGKANKKPYYSRRSGSGYGGQVYFQSMDRLPRGDSPRFDDTPFINTSNPYIRRSRVNTERVFADRGRLKQWQ